MNWDAIGALGEIIGALAVVISVIYLSLQIKQNTAATRSLAHQEHFNAAQEFNSVIAASSELADLIVKANDENENITPSERIRLQHHYINVFTLWHSAFENRNKGLLDDSGWRVWNEGSKVVIQSQKAMRDTWKQAGAIYGEKFVEHVNAVLDELGPVTEESGVWSHDFSPLKKNG